TVHPIHEELCAHPEPRALVADDPRSRTADRLVAARVSEVPVRIEKNFDGGAAEMLRDEACDGLLVLRRAAVHHRDPGGAAEQDDVAAEATELQQSVPQRGRLRRRRVVLRKRREASRPTAEQDRAGTADCSLEYPATLSGPHH